jgi:radical SAM superfamily enzyme YgiQ (UPF0313 family)
MTTRTPAQISRFLDDNMHRFDLPTQYLGDEPNAVGKPWQAAAVRWCLVASWPYEHAAGNSSIPTVYKAINRGRDDFLADRFYLPATPRDLRLLERARIPIFGIETKHPLSDFDVVGTSIAYPVLTMSFTKMLSVAGIPLRWRDRRADAGNHPMIIAGGLGYGAPEILAPVVDCWWLGEVEDEPGNPGIAAVCARIADFKTTGAWQQDRESCYATLAREFNFLYFPRYVDVHYGYEDRSHVGVGPHPSKQVIGYSATLPGMRMPFTRRIVKNLDSIAPLDDPPLLYVDPAMGSGDLEVGRGCPAWCTFCALTYRQKPYRQRSVPATVAYAKALQDNMGSVRMAPFAPDFPMHTQRKKLIADLLTKVSDEVDAPAMRVDDFNADNQFILLQVHGGMDAVTLGVEGNSQRMRDLVGKGTSDADIREAVTRGIRAGIRKFKLFMISNLPGEDEGDLFRILKLAKDLADIRDAMNQPTVRIQFSWTPLMIEANTPMQWFAPTTSSRLLGDVWEEFRDLKIDFKLGAKAEPNKAAFFQLCQRASREVGEAIIDALQATDQACWGGVPRTFKDLLDQQLRARGFHNGFADCFDERAKHDMFGWEFIDQGISSELLWTTYLQMREFVENTDSHTYDTHFDAAYHGNEWIERCDSRCQGKTCGACDYTDLRIRTGYIQAATRETDTDLSTLTPVDQRTQALRIRARLHKGGRHRHVSNDHWRFTIRRAAFRAQTDLHSTFGIAKRSIRLASDEIKHHDWSAGVDYVEFAITRPASTEQVEAYLAAMNTHLHPWTRIGEFTTQPPGATTMRADIDLALYEIDCDTDLSTALARLDTWRCTPHIPLRLRVEGGYFAPNTQEVNAKNHVEDLWLTQHGATLRLRALVRGAPNPYQIYAALMGRPGWLETAHLPATRLDAFTATDRTQQDFLRPNCHSCGLVIPTNLLDQPYHPTHCPRCLDATSGALIAGEDTP